MRMRTGLAGIGLLVLTIGCTAMPPVALTATPADLEILAGEWAGEYESAALGRRGIIEFKLKAGTYDARGDVMMVPAGRRSPYQPRVYQEGEAAVDMASTHLLTIRFIRASNGSVTGMLDRYWDPDRACFAVTTFNGHVAENVVEGTFKTRFDCGAGEARGTWAATKKPAKPNPAWR